MNTISNNVWYFLGAIGFSALISFGFFSIGITEMQSQFKIQVNKHQGMQSHIDSLENVINTELKTRKDTVIVNVSLPQINFYNTENILKCQPPKTTN